MDRITVEYKGKEIISNRMDMRLYLKVRPMWMDENTDDVLVGIEVAKGVFSGLIPEEYIDSLPVASLVALSDKGLDLFQAQIVEINKLKNQQAPLKL